MTSTAAPTVLDHRAIAAEWHRTDRTGETDRVTKAASVFCEQLDEGTYDVEQMRSFWRTYRDAMYATEDAHKRGVFAAMMVATEDAVKVHQARQANRASDRLLLGGKTVARREVNVPRRHTAPRTGSSWCRECGVHVVHGQHERGCSLAPQSQGAGSSKRFENVSAGHYAVELDGALRFFKVDVPEHGKWAGFRFVVGVEGDHHRRLDRSGQMRALTAIAADPYAATVRYGHEIGRCGVCNRRLTDPESVAAGIGPVCAGRR